MVHEKQQTMKYQTDSSVVRSSFGSDLLLSVKAHNRSAENNSKLSLRFLPSTRRLQEVARQDPLVEPFPPLCCENRTTRALAAVFSHISGPAFGTARRSKFFPANPGHQQFGRPSLTTSPMAQLSIKTSREGMCVARPPSGCESGRDRISLGRQAACDSLRGVVPKASRTDPEGCYLPCNSKSGRAQPFRLVGGSRSAAVTARTPILKAAPKSKPSATNRAPRMQ